MQRFLSDRAGATSIEYGVIALVIGAGLLLAISVLADQAGVLWQGVADATPNN